MHWLRLKICSDSKCAWCRSTGIDSSHQVVDHRDPAAKVTKPRPLSSSRHALSLEQVHDLGRIASTTGNDRPLDALMLRLLIETACRRGGLLRLSIDDLNTADCLVRLHEKGGTTRWQPISPTLMQRILDHIEARGGPEASSRVLRYRDGRPAGRRRLDYLFTRFRHLLPWAAALGISAHWIRHTTLTFVERQFGIAVARAYAGHEDGRSAGGLPRSRTPKPDCWTSPRPWPH